MLSDGRVISRPIAKSSCLSCGLVSHSRPLTQGELNLIFAADYAPQPPAAGLPFERHRKEAYAAWVLDLLGGVAVCSVFEVGAGDGSLLLELQRARPDYRLAGIEPAPDSAAAARASGVEVATAFLGPEVLAGRQSDVVVAVNVAEHVADPVVFLRLLAGCVKPGGLIIVICPDGDRPSSELVIFDHAHTFSGLSLRRLALEAGLSLRRWEAAPVELGPFQAAVLERLPSPLAAPSGDFHGLAEARARYLGAWAGLDEALQRRTANEPMLEAFGVGEAANMLRVYAPRAWSRVRRAVIDGGGGSYAGLSVAEYGALRPDPSRALLLAVRPEVQSALRRRLEADGHRVLAWDDLLR